MIAKPAAELATSDTQPRSIWSRLFSRPQTRVVIGGWNAAVEWIAAWTRFGDWILVDSEVHHSLCDRIAPSSWHVLWYGSVAAGDVWAMLAELRRRGETRRILVVHRVADAADLESAETNTLSVQCSDYGATLVLVVEAG
jgi:hypothetical protein